MILILNFSESFSQCFTTFDFTYTEGSGGAINFSSAVDGGTAPYTYTWYYSPWRINPGNGANPSFTFPVNDSFTVCLFVQDNSGCGDSICKAVKVTTAIGMVCPGEASFTVTTQISGEINLQFGNAKWRSVDFGDNAWNIHMDSISAAQHYYHQNGTYTVTSVVYGKVNGFFVPCDTSVQPVTISNIPCTADFKIEHYSETKNDTTRSGFRTYSLSPFGYANEKYYINGVLDTAGALADSNTRAVLFPPGVYEICHVVYGPGGCYDSICQVDSIVYTPLCGQLDFDYSVTGNCNIYQFTTFNSGTPLSSSEWLMDGVVVSNQSNPVISVDFSSSKSIGEHTIKAVGKRADCESVRTFTFTNPSLYTVGSNYDSTGGTANHTYYLYPQNIPNIAYESWDFGDGTVSSLPYPSHTYSAAGTYTVCHQLILTNGCVYEYCDTKYFSRMEESEYAITVIVVNPNGINKSIPGAKIFFYPNPASTQLNFIVENKLTSKSYFTLFNSIGQMVKRVYLNAGEKQFSVNISPLPDGLYFFTIEDNYDVLYKDKLIIEK